MSAVPAGLTLLAVAFAGAATWCWVPGPPSPPVPPPASRVEVADRRRDAPGGPRAGPGRRVLLTAGAGVLPWLVLGGVLGILATAVVCVLMWRWLGTLEPRTHRERRVLLERAVPHLVDLLASTLAAGMSPETALSRVAAAVEEPARGALREVEQALRLGRDPARVWRDLARHPALGPLGRTMARAVESGAPVAEAMHRLAEDLRRMARTDVEARARAAGVRATAPLGVCLLPSFVLLGVVPLVAGFSTMLVGR